MGDDGLPSDIDPGIFGVTQGRRTAIAHHCFGDRCNVGTVFDQEFEYFSVPLIRRLHQRRGTALGFTGIGIRTVLQQDAYCVYNT